MTKKEKLDRNKHINDLGRAVHDAIEKHRKKDPLSYSDIQYALLQISEYYRKEFIKKSILSSGFA